MTLIRVSAPHFVAGLLADGDTVKEAAPILVWHARHCKWSVRALEAYASSKGWTIERVDPASP